MKLTKILIILITLFFSLSAKFLDTRNNASKVFYQKKTYTEIKEAVQDFEKLLLPYFQLKSKSINKVFIRSFARRFILYCNILEYALSKF